MEIGTRRLATLIGSESALSRPVVLGVGITGFAISFRYAALSPEVSLSWKLAIGALSFLVTVALLASAHYLGVRRGWSRPRVGFVLITLVITSILRSTLTSFLVDSRLGSQSLDAHPGIRTLASLIATLVIGLTLAATMQLARERRAATSHLLLEQRRLRTSAESMDAELIALDGALRERALSLLAPTIQEIRELIQDEISEPAAQQLSQRIVTAVNDVVRPASRELAVSSPIEFRQPDDAVFRPPHILTDRMDITRAIRPGWLLILTWGMLLPGPFLLGAQLGVMAVWLLFSLVIALLLVAIKAWWPRQLRVMSVAVGLGVLLLLYTGINVGIQILLNQWGANLRGLSSWTQSSELAVLLRVTLAMLVSIVATLDIHGQQIRASLMATNTQLQGLIARIRRETWLLHRSMSLTIHGTVQSALVSTAMRLSAPGRSQATVDDARRRLEQALSAISAEQGAGGTATQALEDLQGVWESVVRIEFSISPRAELALTQDAGLRQCAVEICREATSNAIRHGHARNIEIVIEVSGGLVEVHVIDDGRGVSSSAVPGLGSLMLDDTCLNWSLHPTSTVGSELIAVLV